MRVSILVFTLLIFNACSGSKAISENASTKEIVTETETEIEVEEEVEETEEVSEEIIIEEEIEETVDIIEVFNHDIWNNLLQKHVSPQGNVNYKGFKADRATLQEYLQLLSYKTPDDTWSQEDKLAYWINAYNAFTVKLIIDKYPIKSIKDINKPWDYRFFKLGSTWYTLNDIEHGRLRKMNDPRIHFAIVCASISCPKLQNEAFVASKINEQLDAVASKFLADSTKNNLNENTIKLSRIFKWFAKDFKKDGSLIDFLNKYAAITISQNAKKSYKEYDWNLNE